MFKVRRGFENFNTFMREVTPKGARLGTLVPVNLDDVAVQIDAEARIEASIIMKAQRGAPKTQDDVPWVAFLNERCEDDDKLRFSFRNGYPSGTMAVRIVALGRDDVFALTFGLGGESFIDKSALESDFGIKTALNICDSERLKRLQTSVHESVSSQTERQLSSVGAVRAFGVNSERELLRAISGAAKPGYEYISALTGRDNISLRLDREDTINWENILPRLRELAIASELTDYRTVYEAFDTFRPVSDPDLVTRLDDDLMNRLKRGECDHIHLSPPEFVDFETRDFSFDEREDAPHFSDLALDDMIAAKRAFRANAEATVLKGRSVYLWDAETGVRLRRWSLYQCIVAETEIDGTMYVLSMGLWRQVSADLKQRVDDSTAGTRIAIDAFLPENTSIWNERAKQKADGTWIGQNQESVYNLAAAADNGVFLFDKAKIEIAGEKIYEVCDLLHSDRVMVNVKRPKSGSSSISHLFLQARFYGEAFVAEPECRSAMREYCANSHRGS